MPFYNVPKNPNYDPSLPLGALICNDKDISNDELVEMLIDEAFSCSDPFFPPERSQELEAIKNEILSRMK